MKEYVDVLGSKYEIKYVELKDADTDGDCDSTAKLIRVRNDNTNNVGNFEELQKSVLRHEIIHAFLFESGLGASWHHPIVFGHDETTVDWFAKQHMRIHKAFEEVGCI